MRALQLIEDRKLETVEIAPPPPPALGEVTLRIRAVALNHFDLAGGFGAYDERQLALGEGHAAPAPDIDVVERHRLDAQRDFA